MKQLKEDTTWLIVWHVYIVSPLTHEFVHKILFLTWYNFERVSEHNVAPLIVIWLINSL